MCFSLNNKYFNLDFAKNLRRTHPLHSFSIGRRFLWLSEKGVSEKEREYSEAEDAAPAKDPVCSSSPVIARDFSDLDFRSSLLYRAFLPPLPFLSFCAVYPATLRLATRRLLPTTSSCNSSILALLASGLSYVSLVGARIAALRRDIFAGFILENIW